jgi:hypothetical protein
LERYGTLPNLSWTQWPPDLRAPQPELPQGPTALEQIDQLARPAGPFPAPRYLPESLPLFGTDANGFPTRGYNAPLSQLTPPSGQESQAPIQLSSFAAPVTGFQTSFHINWLAIYFI